MNRRTKKRAGTICLLSYPPFLELLVPCLLCLVGGGSLGCPIFCPIGYDEKLVSFVPGSIQTDMT